VSLYLSQADANLASVSFLFLLLPKTTSAVCMASKSFGISAGSFEDVGVPDEKFCSCLCLRVFHYEAFTESEAGRLVTRGG